MVKKKYAGKTEEQWRDWGEGFGKRMDGIAKEFEKRGQQLGEEIEGLADNFEKHVKKNSKKIGKNCKCCWWSTFGLIGPMLKSFLGILFLMVMLIAVKFVNQGLGSGFITAVTSFFISNLYLFFAVSLFQNYGEYLSRKFPETLWFLCPVTSSVGFVFAIWVLVSIAEIANGYLGISTITAATSFFRDNLLSILILLVVFSYVFKVTKRMCTR